MTNFEKILKRKKLTGYKFARRIKVDHGSVYRRLKHGIKSLNTAKKYAAALPGVEPWDLIG